MLRVCLKQLITIILISMVFMFRCWMKIKLSTENYCRLLSETGCIPFNLNYWYYTQTKNYVRSGVLQCLRYTVSKSMKQIDLLPPFNLQFTHSIIIGFKRLVGVLCDVVWMWKYAAEYDIIIIVWHIIINLMLFGQL